MPQRPRRLDKYLSEATAWSLVQVKEAWAEGRVAVASPGGEARPSDLRTLVFEDDTVFVDGAPVHLQTVHRHALLYKPYGVVCSARDPDGRADLSPWLRELPSGIFPVGRLDRDSTGLMLLTTDSDLQQAVLRPDQHTHKTYWLWLDDPLPASDPRLCALTEGVLLGGHLLRAEAVEYLGATEHSTELLVTLTEGQNRQIRKMCHALGLRLVHLHRRSIGPLGLGDLAPGGWRFLGEDEVDALWAALGGRERQERGKISALVAQAERARSSGAPLLRLEAWLSEHWGSRFDPVES